MLCCCFQTQKFIFNLFFFYFLEFCIHIYIIAYSLSLYYYYSLFWAVNLECWTIIRNRNFISAGFIFLFRLSGGNLVLPIYLSLLSKVLVCSKCWDDIKMANYESTIIWTFMDFNVQTYNTGCLINNRHVSFWFSVLIILLQASNLWKKEIIFPPKS